MKFYMFIHEIFIYQILYLLQLSFFWILNCFFNIFFNFRNIYFLYTYLFQYKMLFFFTKYLVLNISKILYSDIINFFVNMHKKFKYVYIFKFLNLIFFIIFIIYFCVNQISKSSFEYINFVEQV